MPEVRLIDANALLTAYCDDCNSGAKKPCPIPGRCHEYNLIKEQPTIEAEPIRHGRWIPEHGEPDWYRCSCCMKNTIYSTDNQNMKTFEAYCSRCGARMDEPPEEVQDDDER